MNDDTTAFWEEIGATNQYRMFDQSVNSSTSRTTSIEVELNSLNADSVAFFGLVAKDVTVEFWDAAESALYYSETVDLVYGSDTILAITDWWEYFFGESSSTTEVIVQADNVSYNGLVKIEITQDTGITAECGNVVLGRMQDIGDTRYGSSVGLLDYSQKVTDDDGVISITEGSWAKEHNYSLIMRNSKMASIYRVLTDLRATPTAWTAADESDYSLFITYGILRDFSITVPGPNVSVANLEIEGLT